MSGRRERNSVFETLVRHMRVVRTLPAAAARLTAERSRSKTLCNQAAEMQQLKTKHTHPGRGAEGGRRGCRWFLLSLRGDENCESVTVKIRIGKKSWRKKCLLRQFSIVPVSTPPEAQNPPLDPLTLIQIKPGTGSLDWIPACNCFTMLPLC